MGIALSKWAISVGALTAATITWYFWPVTTVKLTDSKPDHNILGLENTGTTCFLNAVLQALASLQHLEKWLEKNDERNNVSKEDIPSSFSALMYPTIAALYKAVLVVNKVIQKDEYILASTIPIKLATSLRRKGQRIKLTEEQDAVEIMQMILTALYEDVVSIENSQRFGSLACLLDEHEAIEIVKLNSLMVSGSGKHVRTVGRSNEESIVYGRQGGRLNKPICNMLTKLRPPYRGLMASKLECLSCFGKNVITTESFDIMSLPLPMYSSRMLTLKNLIKDYLKPVFVHQVDCETCSLSRNKTVQSTFVKSVAFCRFPKTLCFHIMRTLWSENYNCLSKRIDHVQFPVQLDVSVFSTVSTIKGRGNEVVRKYVVLENSNLLKATKPKPESWYELRAVICHEGDANSGHYTTYRKCPTENNIWFNVSDETVTPVSLREVLACRAYVLLYENT